MTISKKLKKFLDEKGVDYKVTSHPPAYTAQEIAGKQHVPGSQVLKPVIVRCGEEYIMCVLPSTHFIDFEKLEKCTNLHDLELADEEALASLFPDDELGAEPPIGPLSGIETLVDSSIESESEVYFNAGNHEEMIWMKKKDFIDLSKPSVKNFGRHI